MERKGRKRPHKEDLGPHHVAWRRLFLEELIVEVERLGLKRYRAHQLFQWIHGKRITSLHAIENLSREDIERLAEAGYLTTLHLREEQTSQVDGTVKYLFGLADGAAIEAVVIPSEGRKTLCVSSQVGCAYGCAFCATGLMGIRRSLQADEIVEQYYEVCRRGHDITNVVFMGMGEPLANYDAVVRAIRLLNHPEGAQVGARRFTVSTVGLVPQIQALGEEQLQVNLAISLNATTNRLRDQLMPVNRKYPLEALIQQARAYARLTHRRVSFEYVLLAGVNDHLEDALRLGKLLHGMLCHVNLIPFNPVPGLHFERPSPTQVAAFKRVMSEAGIPVSVRESGGPDIHAACGQLHIKHTN